MVKTLISQHRKAVFGLILFIILFFGVTGFFTFSSRQSPICPTPSSVTASSPVKTTLSALNAQRLLISRFSEKIGTSIEMWDIQGTSPKTTFALDRFRPLAAYAPDGKAILYSDGETPGQIAGGLYSLDLSSG